MTGERVTPTTTATPARVRRTLSDRRHSLGRIREWLRELRSATIEIESPRLPAVDRLLGGLIDHVEPSPMTRHDLLSGGERHLWRVRLGKPLVELLKRDLLLWYDPAPLARLRYGISQAVARHVLTHRQPPDKGWKLDGLIKVVCGVWVRRLGGMPADASGRMKRGCQRQESFSMVRG